MKKIVFVVMAILILSFTACENSSYVESTKPVKIITPVAYGNGVYYFHCIRVEFATSLSKFIADGNKKVVAIAGDGTDLDSFDCGYFVVVDTTTVTGGHNADN